MTAPRKSLRLDPGLRPQAVAGRLQARTKAVGRLVRRQRPKLGLLLIAVLLAVPYVLALPDNPPCCFADEPSTAYNALRISQEGVDEYGARYPLFFEAFGEYRSPAQIYMLAGLFEVTGPHLLAGRYMTRTAMLLAILVIALLAYRISCRRSVGAIVALLGLTTPMLYEVSRLGTEGPIVDLPLAIFLLALFAASQRERWGPLTGLGLALPLAAMAYTYPTARPMVPILALGVALFWTGRRWPGIVATWVGLAVLLIPIALFSRAHPGALGGRPAELAWYSSDMSIPRVVWEFVEHFWANLRPDRVLVRSDINPRHHVEGPVGAVLIPMALLAVAGFTLAFTRLRREPWWLFVALGFLLAMVPAVLTHDILHTPRLIMVPIFGLVLCVPALMKLAEQRWAVAAIVGVTLVQAVVFSTVYVREGTNDERVGTFTADFIPAFDAAEKSGIRPIWLLSTAYIHGFWRAELHGIPRSDLVHWVRPPEIDPAAGIGPEPDATQFMPLKGSVAVGGGKPCATCKVLYQGPNFAAWIEK